MAVVVEVVSITMIIEGILMAVEVITKAIMRVVGVVVVIIVVVDEG